MSSFTAINVTDDELDIEEHTRELQIEHALEVFDKALKFQKDRLFESATESYQDLFDIEIIKSRNDTHNPMIEQLKFMAYRNRGFLKISELFEELKRDNTEAKNANAGNDKRSTETEVDGDKSKTVIGDDDDALISRYQRLLSAMNDLTTALNHGEADLKLMQVITEMFTFYGLNRAARFGYEYKIKPSGVDSGVNPNHSIDDLNWNITEPRTLLPNQVEFISRFKELLLKIGDKYSEIFAEISKVLDNSLAQRIRSTRKAQRLDFGKIVSKEEFNHLRNSHLQSSVMEVPYNKQNVYDISVLLENLVSVVPSATGKAGIPPSSDSYMLTTKPIDRITIKFKLIEEPEGEEKDQNGTITADEKNSIVIEDQEKQVKPTDKTVKANTEKDKLISVNSEELTLAQRIAVKRLTRSRNEAKADELTPELFKDQAKFLDEFSRYIELCQIKLPKQDLIQTVISGSLKPKDVDFRIVNFQYYLNHWKAIQSRSLLADFASVTASRKKGSTDDDDNGDDTDDYMTMRNKSIEDILNVSCSSEDNEKASSASILDAGAIFKKLSSFNVTGGHLYQLRWAVIEHLLSPQGSKGGNLITNGSLTDSGLLSLESVVLSLNELIYSYYQHKLEDANLEGNIHSWENALSIFELLVNSYLRSLKQYKDGESNDTQSVSKNLCLVVNNWESLLEDLFEFIDYQSVSPQLWLRFSWAKSCLLRNKSDFSTKDVSTLLSKMSSVGENVEIDIPMVNYDFIPALNLKNIKVQLSKMDVLDAFTNDDKSNKILERILLQKRPPSEETDTEIEMRKLMESSPTLLKLRLWSILLTFYQNEHNIKSYKLGFARVLSILVEELDQLQPDDSDTLEVNKKLLKIISVFCYMATRYVRFLSNERWNMPADSSDKDVLEKLMIFTSFAYVFLLHEDTGEMVSFRHSLKKGFAKAYQYLVSTAVLCYTLVLVYYDLNLCDRSPDKINDFYSIVHVQLGVRHICNNSGGYLLDYMQQRLSELLWEYSDRDFFQIVHCRYGIQVSMEYYEAYDHETEKTKMTSTDAIAVSRYVIPYCYRKKHPLLNPPRNDIKSILDMIYESVGDLPGSNATVRKNNSIITKFLDNTVLSMEIITNAFDGRLEIILSSPDCIQQQAAKNGVYFMQGLMALHTFRIRRRAMQGRSADLDFVIKMLQMDLSSGSQRIESWLLLGEAYSYLVEDDIIWTSDKLNNEEKKNYTASVQKQAILCYLMAVSLYQHYKSLNGTQGIADDASVILEHGEKFKPLAPTLWNLLGRELYSAWMKPMCKLAFRVSASHTHLLGSPFPSNSIIKDSGNSATILDATRIVSDSIFYEILGLVFSHAYYSDNSDWYSLMYLAKVQLKKKDGTLFKSILPDILLSCLIGLKESTREDPIVEPHYIFCSALYRAYKKNQIDASSGLKLLKKDPLFVEVLPETVTSKDEFLEALITALRKCLSYDKKKWQHKPRYKIARIFLDDFQDLEASKKEMDSIINLKPTVRSLSTIWKPDNERPGKHFVYNFMYINFYIDMLDYTAEVYPMIYLIKKLRKLGSSMIGHVKTFDSAVAKACIMIKKIMYIHPGYLDLQITQMVYSEFIKYSKEFIDSLAGKTEFTEWEKSTIFFLDKAYEFRKMANGFAATGIIDDCYHSLYLTLFMPYLQRKLLEVRPSNLESSQEQQPSGKSIEFVADNRFKQTAFKSPSSGSREKIRVARRDITPFCVKLIKTLAPVLSQLKKEAYKGNFLPYDKELVLENREYDDIAAANTLNWEHGMGATDKSANDTSDIAKAECLIAKYGHFANSTLSRLKNEFDITLDVESSAENSQTAFSEVESVDNAGVKDVTADVSGVRESSGAPDAVGNLEKSKKKDDAEKNAVENPKSTVEGSDGKVIQPKYEKDTRNKVEKSTNIPEVISLDDDDEKGDENTDSADKPEENIQKHQAKLTEFFSAKHEHEEVEPITEIKRHPLKKRKLIISRSFWSRKPDSQEDEEKYEDAKDAGDMEKD